jgi:hypothetical protein
MAAIARGFLLSPLTRAICTLGWTARFGGGAGFSARVLCRFLTGGFLSTPTAPPSMSLTGSAAPIISCASRTTPPRKDIATIKKAARQLKCLRVAIRYPFHRFKKAVVLERIVRRVWQYLRIARLWEDAPRVLTRRLIWLRRK